MDIDDDALLSEAADLEELAVVNPPSTDVVADIGDDLPTPPPKRVRTATRPPKPPKSDAESNPALPPPINVSTQRGVPGAAPQPQNYVATPSPRFTRYFSNSDDPNRKTSAFYNKYWSQLGPAALIRCIVYVYREWPVLLPIPDDSKENAYIDKIPAEQIIRDDIEFNDRYGAGDFKCYFNEELPIEVARQEKTKTSRTLAELYIRGSRDLKSRPPSDRRISDVRNVSLTDPQNTAYVEFLRMQGHLPNQIDEIRRQGDVATVQAVDRMAQMNENLTQKLIDRADNQNKDQGSVAEAASEAVRVVADAATRSNQMMQETFAQIRAQQGDGGSAMLTQALELADKLAARSVNSGGNGGNGGGGDNSAIVTELMSETRELRNTIATMQAAQIASLERRLDKMSERSTTVNADGSTNNASGVPATPMDAVKQSIGAFKEVKNLVDEITGGGGEDDGGGGPAWLKTVAQIAPVVGQVVTAARDMYALSTVGANAAGMGGGGQQQRQQVQQQPQPQPQYQQSQPQYQQQPPQQQFQPQYQGQFQPPPQTQPQQMNTQSEPQPQSQPQQQPSMPTPDIASSSPTGLHPDVVALLYAIRFPLINHFEDYCMGGDDCLDGKAFADWFIGGFTEQTYDTLRSFGTDSLIAALFAFPPIAGELNRINRLDKLMEFVNQFMAFSGEVGGKQVEDEITDSGPLVSVAASGVSGTGGNGGGEPGGAA